VRGVGNYPAYPPPVRAYFFGENVILTLDAVVLLRASGSLRTLGNGGLSGFFLGWSCGVGQFSLIAAVERLLRHRFSPACRYDYISSLVVCFLAGWV